MSEFDIYCQKRSTEERARLSPIRDLIQSTLPETTESRVHFYLSYDFGAGSVVKLDHGTKSQPRLTFGVEEGTLSDPAKLMKGTSGIVKVKSAAWLEANTDHIADLLRQRMALAVARWDGVYKIPERDRLRPDQPSP